MSAFPPGAPNFQLPRPLRGVVYFDQGRLVVLVGGKKVIDKVVADASLAHGEIHAHIASLSAACQSLYEEKRDDDALRVGEAMMFLEELAAAQTPPRSEGVRAFPHIGLPADFPNEILEAAKKGAPDYWLGYLAGRDHDSSEGVVTEAMVSAALPHLVGVADSDVRPVGQFYPGQTADESEETNWQHSGRERVRRALTAALAARGGNAHPDDIAVDKFAAAMKAKMAKQRAKGYGGWDEPLECAADLLRERLRTHVGKGDSVDVGNFAMMLFNRGESTAVRGGEKGNG